MSRNCRWDNSNCKIWVKVSTGTVACGNDAECPLNVAKMGFFFNQFFPHSSPFGGGEILGDKGALFE